MKITTNMVKRASDRMRRRVNKEFATVRDGEEVTPVMDDYLMKCCDCGLVHKMTFRALKVTGAASDGTWNAEELDKKEYRVMLKANRV